MAIQIAESFEISAPVEQVWEFISDPTQVVTCLPGAELTQVVDDKTYEGKVKVKVGPVHAAYKGLARIEERDRATHTIRVTAEGKETTGAGLAKAGMVGKVQAKPDGGTMVIVTANVDVKGRLAQFGGGLIQEVARQIFRQFAENVQTALSTPAANPLHERVQPAQSDAAAAPAPAKPTASSDINALSLILKSVGTMFSRFFSRLFGSAR